MTEQEALAITNEFVAHKGIRVLGVERAFFVPVTAFETRPPWLRDSWVVHFRLPEPDESQFDRMLRSDPTLLIVTVNTETKEASILSTL